MSMRIWAFRRALSSSRVLARGDNKIVEVPHGNAAVGGKVSGAPEALEQRVVRIYKQAPSATQVGLHQSKYWRLDWDVVDRANRWEDHTIGYASSGDYMQGTQIHFRTKEDAVRFATKQGWDYYVSEPHPRIIVPKQYATNFLHSKGPLKHIRTK